MRIEQARWTREMGWERFGSGGVVHPQLVLYFGARSALAEGQAVGELGRRYPGAHLVGCSTAGEILGEETLDETVVATALEFDTVRVDVACGPITRTEGSAQVGEELARRLLREDLRALLIVSDGLLVNGSELVRGVLGVVGPDLPVSGGLAGDGPHFETTLVGCDGPPVPHQIALVGLYGSALRVGRGSVGGWSPFGPRRRITRSRGNVLYELDGKPVLPLYKRYLGDAAARLPGSALLFPLRVRRPDSDDPGVVRTILAVDESTQSMVFAGDVPEGHIAELMHASFDRLIDGAGEAATLADSGAPPGARLALLVSCVGRKMLLGARAAEEVEEVLQRLGPRTVQVGFYSYGEIGPQGVRPCELHNQTMTIMLIGEAG